MFEELSIHDEPGYDEPLLGYSTGEKNYSSHSSSRRRFLTTLTFLIVGLTAILTSMAAIFVSVQDNPRQMLETSSQYTRKLEVTPGVLFGLAIAFGFIICFVGYRLVKPALFMTGFLSGSVICYDLTRNSFRYEEWGDIATVIAVIAAGTLLAFAVVLLYRAGIFILGAAAGVLFASYIHTALLHRIAPEHPNTILYVAMGLFGVMFGILAYRYERPIVIACTAWIGAYECIRGIGYFAGGYPVPTDLRSSFTVLNPGQKIRIDDEYWWYFVATLVMCAAGMLLQIRVTARDIYHTGGEKERSAGAADIHGQYQLSEQPTQLI